MKKLFAVLPVLALMLSVLVLSACDEYYYLPEVENGYDTVEDLSDAYESEEEVPIIEEPVFAQLSGSPIVPYGEPVFVPILMYHTSSEANPNSPLPELYVRPSEFERQLIWLNENNFTFITFDDWDNLHYIYNPIMLTFDDGYPANYTEIFPLLQQHNARITLFLTPGLMAAHGLTEEMVRAMSDSGLVKFEAHSMTHPDFVNISSNIVRLGSELREPIQFIEELTGLEVLALAYPAGRHNATVREWTARYYRFGVVHYGGMHNTSIDNFQIRRIRINRSTSLDTFIRLVTTR